MTHPSEFVAANAISILRHLDLSQTIENGQHFVPDIYLSWDTEGCDIGVSLKSVPGKIMQLWGTVEGTPRWVSLNFSLGDATFQAGDVLGTVIEYEGCEGHTFAPFIRSLREKEITDAHFQDYFIGSQNRVIHTMLHSATSDSDLVGAMAYHTLVIPLPRVNFMLDIRDLRSFVVPAARGWRKS